MAINLRIRQILLPHKAGGILEAVSELHLFYNHLLSSAVDVAVNQHPLSLYETWGEKLTTLPRPTKHVSDMITGQEALTQSPKNSTVRLRQRKFDIMKEVGQ